MMTLRICLWLVAALPLVAKIDPGDWALSKAVNVEESLFLRRIADFWQEGEYLIAKSQMEEFLDEFPESRFSDPIRVCLGDIHLREKNFPAAIAAYSSLSNSEFTAKAFLNRLQTLYCLEWYSTLADECEEYLKTAADAETKIKATYYLAIALYHQCLNASKNPEALVKLAKRAEPHFETLLQSELSTEVSQASAHLCCILKDYPKAAAIYLALSKSDSSLEEEMTFQAALIQVEYDKNLALASFESLAKNGKSKAPDAAYNHLVLSFDIGRHEHILQHKDAILASVAEAKKSIAHLFIGRSFLELKKFREAIEEFTAFLADPPSPGADSLRSGLLCLMEAAHQCGEIGVLDLVLSRLSQIDPGDSQIAKGRLLRALLLKNLNQSDEARKELIDLLAAFADFPDRQTAFFELADLEYQSEAWGKCRERCRVFLDQFPNADLSPFAWRYLAASSSRLAAADKSLQNQLSSDLLSLLEHKELFSPSEISDWTFYLAESYFNSGRCEEAFPLLEEPSAFPQEANASLLLGLCYRDARHDTAAFCRFAEKAIEKNQTLMAAGDLHVSLFNAYLEISLLDKSADHLYQALLSKAEITKENLLWLGEWYFSRNYQRATNIYAGLVENVSQPALLETPCYKLGKLHSLAKNTEAQISVLEKLLSVYQENPSIEWKWQEDAYFILAEGYRAKGDRDKALSLLDAVIGDDTAIRSETMARAYFDRAAMHAERLKKWSLEDPELIEIASQFKDLILQRKIAYEPIHLEAALEYVNLLEKTAENRIEKRIALLEKIKTDFGSEDDLLSKDYHQSRAKNPEKNRIFEDYMRLIDAEILMAKSDLSIEAAGQKELQAKAKDLLLQMKSESSNPRSRMQYDATASE